MKKYTKYMILLCLISVIISGCAKAASVVNDLKGSITGNTYECQFYSNTGNLTMTAEGSNIDISENIIKERTYNSNGEWGYTKVASSVITITIDGHQIESCGDTVLFVENGLQSEVDFTIQNIYSSADGIEDNVIISKLINDYKNSFGKSVIVVIKSQLGDPITAYSGEKVYWEVCQDLPKTTKLYIDGKALYIHRANFQIIDKELLIS